MPEVPDIVVYAEALTARIVGQPIEAIRLLSPFILRSVTPPVSAFVGHEVESIARPGKLLVFKVKDAGYLVIHLMIAGRFRWLPKGKKPPGRIALAAFDFPNGTLVLTEAGTQRRASLYAIASASELASFDRGGIEPLEVSFQEFSDRMSRRSARGWPYTDGLDFPARCVDHRYNAFATRRMKPITASPVRPTGNCWPIARCRNC